MYGQPVPARRRGFVVREPRWWQHRTLWLCVVYLPPLVTGVTAASLIAEQHSDLLHLVAGGWIGFVLQTLCRPALLVFGGAFGVGESTLILAVLIAVPPYGVFRHPATAVLSFFASWFWVWMAVGMTALMYAP